MSGHRWGHHPPCPGGCGELADECACRRPNPLGSMRIVEPVKRHDDEPCVCGTGFTCLARHDDAGVSG